MKEKKARPLKQVLKWLGMLLLLIVCLVAAMLVFLSVTEYRPADRETLDIAGEASAPLHEGDSITVLTWNMGYGALGDNADFFMDGGAMVATADEARVQANLEGMIDQIEAVSPDLLLLQEVDVNSARSHHINETALLRSALPGYQSTFANNFKVAFLPYPVPPIGKVDSGIMAFSRYPITSAERIQLPIPFSWPMRMANLKRCLNICRIPLEGSDRELVLIDLHLEAYDDGEGKAAQTEMLRQILVSEAASGNYVIAGGDFNQIFSSADTAAYPAQEGKWAAGEIDVTVFDSGWQFLMDASVPSCRSLDQPYAGADREGFQYYLIDGFIVSGNVTVQSLENLDLDFACSDHNPVLMQVALGSDN